MIADKYSDLIGKTPLYRLSRLEKKFELNTRLLAKLEMFNPAGSVKDRIAYSMITAALESGELKQGGTIIEPTSGNTGIGIAAICASMGLSAILVMPDTMSVERQKLIKSYGAKLILTNGQQGMNGAVKAAAELLAEHGNAVTLSQFENKINPQTHYQTTARELWEDCGGGIDYFVAGIGTGGTISGVGKFLKEQNKDVKIIGVEPQSSPFLTDGIKGSHKIQGIGAGFCPLTYDGSVVDEIITVGDGEAAEFKSALAVTEGLLCGISSGAALCAAVKYIKKTGSHADGKTLAVILPDTGERYLSADE